ncbi:hypothetical protein K503DRAFT_806000, partial [Rhizopogon vinicolor AM-OR11-026]
ADATRRLSQRRRRDNINPDRPLPPGFFNDSPRDPPPSRRRPLSPSPARRHHVAGHLSLGGRTLLGRLSSLFRQDNYNTPDAPPPLRFLEWAQKPLFNSPRRRDEGMELQDRRLTTVDVPFTGGKPRNISAAQIRMKKERERVKKAKKACASNSRPPHDSVTQQSGGAAQAQSSTELHADVATPDVAATSAATTLTMSLPDAIIPRAGRWTRFRLFVCCISAQYTDGYH